MLIIFTVYASSLWGLDVVSKEMSFISNYDAFKRMASYSKDTILLMNMKQGDATIELVGETHTHLSEFWGREDIKTEYLNLQNLPKQNYVIVSSSQFPRGYPEEELRSLFKNKFTSIEKTSRKLIVTTPLELIKQTTKKLFNLIVYKKKFTTEGIYTYYYNYNNWYFYHE
jgi:hypothetical protein